MTIIKRFYLLIFVILLIHCNTNEKSINIKETSDISLQYKYIFLYSNKLLLLNDSLDLLDSFLLNDTIRNFYNRDNIYITGKKYYIISKNNFQIIQKDNELEENIPINEEKNIFVLNNEVLIKTKYKQNSLIKIDTTISKVWMNPLHNYIYILDSKDYLYSINFEENILKRKIFIGKIRKLQFEKLGTRVYIITNNSFIILDYETLNIIYEQKGIFNKFSENNKYNQLYLLRKEHSIDIISSINYNLLKSINRKNIKSIISNNDSLTVILYEKSNLDIFSNKNIFITSLSFSPDSIVFFHDKYLGLSYKDTLLLFNVLTKHICKKLPGKNFLHIFPILIDSINKNYTTFLINKNQKKINLIEKKEIEHFYTVQIYSFADMFSAQKAVEKEQKKNPDIKFFIKKYKKGKEKIFRVYAGRFESKKNANNFRKILISKGYKNDIFSTYISSENIIE